MIETPFHIVVVSRSIALPRAAFATGAYPSVARKCWYSSVSNIGSKAVVTIYVLNLCPKLNWSALQLSIYSFNISNRKFPNNAQIFLFQMS